MLEVVYLSEDGPELERQLREGIARLRLDFAVAQRRADAAYEAAGDDGPEASEAYQDAMEAWYEFETEAAS